MRCDAGCGFVLHVPRFQAGAVAFAMFDDASRYLSVSSARCRQLSGTKRRQGEESALSPAASCVRACYLTVTFADPRFACLLPLRSLA